MAHSKMAVPVFVVAVRADSPHRPSDSKQSTMMYNPQFTDVQNHCGCISLRTQGKKEVQ